jgi:hypothetical protein
LRPFAGEGEVGAAGDYDLVFVPIGLCYTRLGGKTMLRTVEAEIKPDGTVTLLEPVEVRTTARALVTVLENGDGSNVGNVSAVLELMQSPEFKNRRSYPAEQIEAQIEEAWNSWE